MEVNWVPESYLAAGYPNVSNRRYPAPESPGVPVGQGDAITITLTPNFLNRGCCAIWPESAQQPISLLDVHLG